MAVIKAEGTVFPNTDRLRPVNNLLIFLYVIIKNYNFLDCDWFKKLLFSTNSLAKLSSDTLLLDSLLSDNSISQSHSKL